ncbi:MAG: FHA domain-containing protein [Pseudomonadota bacterium]
MWREDLEVVRVDGKPGGTWRVPFPRRRISIGRGVSNDIILLDPSVPLHAVITGRDDGPFEVGPYRCRARRCFSLPTLVGMAIFSLSLTFATSIFLGQPAVRFSETEPSEVPLPARGSYGRLEEGRSVSRLSFRFEHSGRDGVLLHYIPGGLTDSSALSIELNGVPIGFVPVCPGDWGIEQRLMLPLSGVRLGWNRISFSMRSPESAPSRWGLRGLYVTAVPLDRIVGEDADSLLAAADRLLREGGESPGRLAEAGRLVNRAIERFQVGDGPLPARAIVLRRGIDRARNDLYDAFMAEARRASRLGDRERAKGIYAQLLSGFTEVGDSRRRKITYALEELTR